MITANQEYTITSVEDEKLFLTIDVDTTSSVKFIHVPVVTDYASTKWKLVGENKIQLYAEQDVYIAVANILPYSPYFQFVVTDGLSCQG